jgi:type IV pilus assembly protein PilM
MALTWKREKVAIGLDIGTFALKMVVLERKGKGFVLKEFGIEKLPPDAIVGGEIMDRQAVVEAISFLSSRLELPLNRVVTNISGRGVILKKITVPLMGDAELAESIEWQIKENIPFDLTDVIWDYRILKRDPSKNQMELLLVAAKNEAVYNLIDIVKSAGLKPVALDLDPIAWTNTLLVNDYLEDLGHKIGVINVGYDTSGVLILQDGVYHAHRDVPLAGKVYIEALMRFLDLDMEKASKAYIGEPVEGTEMEEIAKITASINEKMGEHIERLFPIFRSQEEAERLEKIYITGGSAWTVGLADFLQERYRVPVEIVNAFRKISLGEELVEEVERLSPIYTTAVGLALRRLTRVPVDVNLLPPEEREKEVKPFLSLVETGVVVAPIVAVLTFALVTSLTQKSKIKRLEEEISKIKVEENALKVKIKELKEIERRQKEIRDKLNIIENLSLGKYNPVILLDEINRIIPDGVWLTELEEEEGGGVSTIKIKGATTSIFRVADFLKKLEGSSYFSNIQLNYAKKDKMNGGEIIAFEIVSNFSK